MITLAAHTYGLSDFHAFFFAAKYFLYLVPRGWNFEVDGTVRAAIEGVGQDKISRHELLLHLSEQGIGLRDALPRLTNFHRGKPHEASSSR